MKTLILLLLLALLTPANSELSGTSSTGGYSHGKNYNYRHD